MKERYVPSPSTIISNSSSPTFFKAALLMLRRHLADFRNVGLHVPRMKNAQKDYFASTCTAVGDGIPREMRHLAFAVTLISACYIGVESC